MKRKKQKRTVGIYLWKIILYIIVFFAIVVSVECFFLVEKTVENLISGTSEEHNSFMETDLKEEIAEEDTPIVESSDDTEIIETSTPAINDELNMTDDEPNSDETVSSEPSSDEPTPTDVGSIDDSETPENVLVCNNETHTHIGVCYDANVSEAERNEIYNLVQEISELPEYSELLNNLTSYVSTYNSTPSDANYNSYNTYISDITSKINSANTIAQKYKNTSNYEYIENSSKLEKLVNNSGNLAKIISCNEVLKSLTKWSVVTQRINTFKTNSNITEYKTYLTTISNTVNTAQQNFTNQSLNANFNKYVLNYTNYETLLNVPTILKCAEILEGLPNSKTVVDEINKYKQDNNIEGVIAYLTTKSTEIEAKNNEFKKQNLASSYNTYVINYNNFDTLNKIYFSDVINYTEQIETLPIFDDVIQSAKDFKEKNQISEYILYLEEWEKSNRDNINKIYNNINKQTNLNTEYIINYQKLSDLYDMNIEEVIDVLKKIQELPPIEGVNLSDTKVRTQIISTSQLYKSVINKNIYFSELIINYEKLAALEEKFDDSDTELEFSIQHYAYLNTLSDSGSTPLTIIDTSGKNMPKNKGSDKISPTGNFKNIYIDENGNIQYNRKLTEIYTMRTYKFSTYFNDLRADNMLKFTAFYDTLNVNYKLSQIWVLLEGKDATSVNEEDFARYDYVDGLYFSRDMSDPNAIYVPNETTIRYVYETIPINTQFKTDFYDYDISTGWIFRTNETPSNPSSYNHKFSGDVFDNNNVIKDSYLTWARGNSGWNKKGIYTYTYQSGINSNNNYPNNSNVKLAFGNQNTGTGLGTLNWSKDGYSNQLNKYNNRGYQGCTFGLVEGLSEGKIQYASGIRAPYLFNDGNAAGKENYDNGQYSLEFIRRGDNYTLTSVTGTEATNLEHFSHPGTYNNIWTNNFWPMDSAPSFGTDKHDIKFGGTAKDSSGNTYNLMFGPKEDRSGDKATYTLPASDDGQFHNSYFGMHCEFTFKVSTEYVGPLEWYFFGDDDLWVFLDDQLIVDIGGVHTSVGEYANLWDYIDKGVEEEHKISFFFTERGASGSTCWMRFSLPVVEETQEDVTLGNLRIDKNVVGSDTQENFNFIVTLRDKDNQELSEYYHYKTHKSNGEVIEDIFESGGTVTFNKDEYVTLEGIPSGTTYNVEEIENDDFFTQTQNTTGKIVGNSTVTATITNTYNVNSVKVTKKWMDNINSENRPTNIQVKLLPKLDGKEIDENDPDFPKVAIYARLNEANNWSYTWNRLPKYKLIYDEAGKTIIDKKEIEYTVEEVYTEELAENYYEMPSTINENGDTVLTNALYRNIEITKIDAHDTELKLGGAEFKLEKLKETEESKRKWEVDEDFEPIIDTTSIEEEDLGKLTFGQLKCGTYRLTEIQAPSGYNINKKIIEIDINEDSDITIQIEIKNKKGAVLPFTGGEGTNVYAISGILMILYVYSDIRRQRAALNRKLKPKRRKIKKHKL